MRSPLSALRRLVAAAFLVTAALPAPAADDGQAVLHLLDYVAVEYPQFVVGGKVVNESEYAEQVEFSANAQALIAKLPDHPRRAMLVQQAQALADAIKARADGAKVSATANALKLALIEVYGLQVAPRKVAPLADAATLYQSRCATCHGETGRGDGPAAAGLAPKPSNFRDASRQARRSVYGLYGTISMGVEGTSMVAFTDLDDAQRWALAFLVSGFVSDDPQRNAGAALWTSGKGRDWFKSTADVVLTTPQEATARGGGDAAAVLAYLRSNPAASQSTGNSPLDVSIQTLSQSFAAYKDGNAKRAYDLAVSAYLEGFELAEAKLDSVDRALRPRIEAAMLDYRNQVKANAPLATVEALHTELQRQLHEAKDRLAGGEVSPQAQFVSSFIIIVREGLEAILVLAGMAAFLRRTGRSEGLKWLHGGWIGALALGALTWWIATVLIEVSGAQREVTEGITALLASVTLLYVGFWLHSKSAGQRWSAFIKSQVSGALGRGTLWGLAVISFLAVYREVFETVLFYEALIAQGGATAVVSGFAAGCAVLVVLALLIVRFSAKLPIGVFFAVSSVLLALMAVVFAGQGVAALQAAGKLPSSPVSFPSVPLLGIYPNLQGLVLQLLLLVLIVGAYVHTSRAAARTA
ncbi:MAG: cytochrome c/FTR1 family iron permease [Burkholderiales bacterium]|nr:cytochrome c/FTR1 family iron permease [Burkholderiales bacterium]